MPLAALAVVNCAPAHGEDEPKAPEIAFISAPLAPDEPIRLIAAVPDPPGGNASALLPFDALVFSLDKAQVDLHLTEFVNPGGERVEVVPEIVERPRLRFENGRLKDVLLATGSFTLRLTAQEWPPMAAVSGRLRILQDGRLIKQQDITLSPPAAPLTQLTVTPKTIPLYHDGAFWTLIFGPTKWPTFTVSVKEKSGQSIVRGVYATVEELALPPYTTLDPSSNLKMSWNGTEAALLQPVTGADRTVSGNQPATVKGTVRDLAPGAYTIKLKFSGANTDSSADEELTLNVKVRDHWMWPALMILGALAFTYFATKGLSIRRERLTLRDKIAALRPAWLFQEPPSLPAIAVRAMLRQAAERCEDRLLSAPDYIEAVVAKAEQIMKPLARVSSIRRKLAFWPQDNMIRRRAQKALRRILEQLDPGTISQELSTELEAELKELESWMGGGDLTSLYWADLKPDIDFLLSQVHLGDFPDSDCDRIRAIRDLLTYESPPSLPEEAIAREWNYAVLKLLWERRDDEDLLRALIAKLPRDYANPPNTAGNIDRDVVETLFKIADRAAWKGTKEAFDADDMRLDHPLALGAQSIEAYQPLKFEIVPKTKSVGANYLFKHGLTYQWRLVLVRSDAHSGIRHVVTLQPVTNEPRLIQYVPQEGWLHVRVQPVYQDEEPPKPLYAGNPRFLDDDWRPVTKNATGQSAARAYQLVDGLREGLEVRRSSQFKMSNVFHRFERLGLMGAVLIGVLTGLGTLYFAVETFGSAADYVSLFLWGVGTETARTLAQNFERFAGRTASQS